MKEVPKKDPDGELLRSILLAGEASPIAGEISQVIARIRRRDKLARRRARSTTAMTKSHQLKRSEKRKSFVAEAKAAEAEVKRTGKTYDAGKAPDALERRPLRKVLTERSSRVLARLTKELSDADVLEAVTAPSDFGALARALNLGAAIFGPAPLYQAEAQTLIGP